MRRITADEKIQIRDWYLMGQSTTEIAEKLSVSVTIICYHLKKMGVQIRDISTRARKYILKEGYFSAIDNHTKAYFLGWFYSDGCVFENGKSLAAKITLHKQDLSILQGLSIELYNQDVCTKQGKYVTLSVYSEKFCKDLINLGCMQRKSAIIEMPTGIQEKFLPSFLLGFFNGDGCISIRKRNKNKKLYAEVLFTSNLTFLTQLQKYLISKLEIKSSIQKRVDNFGSLRISNIDDVLKIYRFMYGNGVGGLWRKQEKFMSFFNSRSIKYV